MNEGSDRFGRPGSLRRLFWAVLIAGLLLLVFRCSVQANAQLEQYKQHHHQPAVTQ